GWARDDLLTISGDGRAFGYGNIITPTFAFALTRNAAPVPAPPAPPVIPAPVPAPVTPAPIPAPPPPPAPPVVTGTLDLDQVRTASFNITAGFEGGGYS